MSANLRAFLAMIRWAEGTAGPDGYRTMFGGDLFDSFADHPRKAVTRMLGGKPLTSTAAGAYQFLSRTWDECKARLSLPDFSPESQDLAAIYLIKRRGALEDVETGRLEAALRKCSLEWASLPFSPYGQPIKTFEQCRDIYLKAGGFLDSAYAPAQEFKPASLHDIVTGKDTPMPSPFLIPAFQVLAETLPTLIRKFGKPGSESAERNAQAAEVVVPLVKEALGAKNEQEVVERVTTDPAALQLADKAVEQNWLRIEEAGGGGIAGAREANLKAADTPLLRQPAVVMAALVLPLIYMVVYAVMFRAGFSDETRVMVVSLVVGGVLGAMAAFFWGSSMSSRTKDEALARSIR